LPDELEKAVEQLELAGVSASSLVKSGGVAKTIAATAASGEFDLIVIGSRTRRGLRRFFSRSIPEQVLNSSPASVLVVRSEVGR
jgi:nucleotide-binding universal stress UspA family protein